MYVLTDLSLGTDFIFREEDISITNSTFNTLAPKTEIKTHRRSMPSLQLSSTMEGNMTMNPSTTMLIDSSMCGHKQLGKIRTERILKNLNISQLQIQNQMSRSNAMKLLHRNKA